jgi:hypothetical protein
MTKTKLAWLILIAAFGVNLFAFIFFKKNWVIEENKTIWLYELPKTASALDSYVNPDFGPAQAVIGTLVIPGFQSEAVQLGLAQSYEYDASNSEFIFNLDPELKFSDDSIITSDDFVQSAVWMQNRLKTLINPKSSADFSAEWLAWIQSTYQSDSPHRLKVKIKIPTGSSPNQVLNRVFSHVWTGPIHAKNLASLKAARFTEVTKDWISSGPYRIRKWRPKEITLASRDQYRNGTKGIPVEYFRVLKFQSAPVKNPAADFAQAIASEGPMSPEHKIKPLPQQLHVFWICRSFKEPSSLCSDAGLRSELAKAFQGLMMKETDFKPTISESSPLAGKKVRYRIPEGSELFREALKHQIQDRLKRVGANAEEISFLFKNSQDADLELMYVVTPDGTSATEAMNKARVSTRMGNEHANGEPDVMGEIANYPVVAQIKGDKKKDISIGSLNDAPMYRRVFLEPDPVPQDLKF